MKILIAYIAHKTQKLKHIIQIEAESWGLNENRNIVY